MGEPAVAATPAAAAACSGDGADVASIAAAAIDVMKDSNDDSDMWNGKRTTSPLRAASSIAAMSARFDGGRLICSRYPRSGRSETCSRSAAKEVSLLLLQLQSSSWMRMLLQSVIMGLAAWSSGATLHFPP